MAYDWQEYVNVTSREAGQMVDWMVPTFRAKYRPEDRRGLRRQFEYGGFAWDKRIELHAPIYIYEYQGQPVAWFTEEELMGYCTGGPGPRPSMEEIG